MKQINEYINKSNGTMSALYLANDEDKNWTINVNGSKNISSFKEPIQVCWDPHSGIYFMGTTEKLEELAKYVKEQTHLEKDSIEL